MSAFAVLGGWLGRVSRLASPKVVFSSQTRYLVEVMLHFSVEVVPDGDWTPSLHTLIPHFLGAPDLNPGRPRGRKTLLPLCGGHFWLVRLKSKIVRVL